jgi:2-methylcitrate dehydratase PrpD
VHDRTRIELSKKVQVVHDPAITAEGARMRHKVRVEVHFRDGSVEREMRESPRGSEHSFAPAAEIVEKFCKLTRHAMPQSQQEALIQAVLGMEKLADGKELVRLLGTHG